jgi:hypothetical protein
VRAGALIFKKAARPFVSPAFFIQILAERLFIREKDNVKRGLYSFAYADKLGMIQT